MKTTRELVRDLIKEYGSFRKAAKALGVTHGALQYWIKQELKRKSSIIGVRSMLLEKSKADDGGIGLTH